MPDTAARRVEFSVTGFRADQQGRTLSGMLLPFGVVSEPAMDGERYLFTADTVTLPDQPVILNYGHDGWSLGNQLGASVALSAEPDGVHATFRIARTPEGDRVLALAADGVLRSFSAEMDGTYNTDENGVRHADATALTGAAVVPRPAFTDAAITSVAASAARTEGRDTMPETETPVETETAPVVDLSAITDAISQGFATLSTAETAQPVPAGNVEVTDEPLPYRIGLGGGEHEFSTDLFAAIRFSDGEARQRIDEFIEARFAVATTDVNELNPNRQRPDLYVDYVTGPTPVFAALYSGPLADATPFVIPQYSSDSNLEGDHTEGQAPASLGTFVTTSMTVTPAAVSSETEINREVIMAGGNPQVSSLIWNQITNRYSEAMEAKAAAVLTGSAAAELGAAITAGASNETAADAVEAGLLGLLFANGAERYDTFLGHEELYTALANARQTTTVLDSTDTPVSVVTDHKRYPILAPANATGQTQGRFKQIDVAGYACQPAASLGASGTGQKSYVFASEAAHIWASAPQRIDWTAAVEKVNVGMFGVYAGAITNVALVQKVTFDSTP